MISRLNIPFSKVLLCLFCMVVLVSSVVFAQKIDTSRLSIKPKPKVVNRTPIIKSNIQPYRPTIMGYIPTTIAEINAAKNNKLLTILKIYPNPVSDQININLRIDKETTFSVKITDILGNDISTLANEKISAGEQTKTYTIPSKLNTGIYFLKIIAGGEQIVKRISVL